MNANQKSKGKSFLRLVVNARGRLDSETNAQTEEDDATQLEMFSQPNAIYFAAVRDLAFEDVKSLIERYHFHHIVDLREVPYLNFGHSSRDAFFRFLTERAVDYLSLFSVATLRNKTSVHDLFDKRSPDSDDFSDELSGWIEHGPTLVLISKRREDDVVASSFSKFLTQSKIVFSELAS